MRAVGVASQESYADAAPLGAILELRVQDVDRDADDRGKALQQCAVFARRAFSHSANFSYFLFILLLVIVWGLCADHHSRTHVGY